MSENTVPSVAVRRDAAVPSDVAVPSDATTVDRETDVRRTARARAELALRLSVQAMSAAPPDTGLARLLLSEAVIAATAALSGDRAATSLESARERLEARAELSNGKGGREAIAALESDSEPRLEELQDAEALVVRVLRASSEGSRFRLGRRGWRGIAVLALVVAAVVAAPFLASGKWERYTWRASSSAWGFKRSGTLAERGTAELLFHTDQEKEPWVVIDMLEPRTVSRLVIRNRLDCCANRGLPLIVEVGMNEKSFERVGRRTTTFQTWKLDFEPRQARYVRLRAEATTNLHLSEIQIP